MVLFHKCRVALTGIALIMLAASCGKQRALPTECSVKFTVQHEVDSLPLDFDTLFYTNKAGNLFSVTRVRYYVSGFKFISENGSAASSGAIFYVDAEDLSTCTILVEGLPPGQYDRVEFNVGLSPGDNQHGMLPNTNENVNMMWPEMMGGGYHFLKFEGHSSDSIAAGYAMHLGGNSALVKASVDKSMKIIYQNQPMELVMNLNEWFANPNTIDFNVDETYIMGNVEAMNKVAANGSNAFTIR